MKLLKPGHQEDLLLIIADCNPAPRYHMELNFAGDERQFTNAKHNLKKSGLIGFGSDGVFLTESGLEMARLCSERRADIERQKQQAKAKVKPVAVLAVPSPPKKLGDIEEKIVVLDKLGAIVAEDMARVLEQIKGDYKSGLVSC